MKALLIPADSDQVARVVDADIDLAWLRPVSVA